MATDTIVQQLIEAGAHYGHRTSLWNPKMAPYIFGRKDQIHILDIRETMRGYYEPKKYLSQVASGGSLILFVGTSVRRENRFKSKRLVVRCRLFRSVGWEVR